MIQPCKRVQAVNPAKTYRGALMKRGLIIGSSLLVLAAIAVFLLFSTLDTLITEAVIKVGSEVTQTRVSLDKTEISAISGKGTLYGLKIGNPENFESESLFELDEISLTLDVTTLTDPTIVIKEIVIAAPEVTYERRANTSNFDVIQKNADAYMNKMDKGSSDSKGQKSSEVKLIVERLYIRDAKVKVIAPDISEEPMTVKLATLELIDIGKAKGGGSPAELIQEILGAIRQNVVKSLMIIDLGEGQEILRGTASEIREQMEKGIEGTRESLEEKGESIGDSIADIFKKGIEGAVTQE